VNSTHATLTEIYGDHFDGLDEEGRVRFLLQLKHKAYDDMDDDAMRAFKVLGERWLEERLV
jgi:hypothetical protein